MADSTKPHSTFPHSSSRIHPKHVTTTKKGKSCTGFILRYLFLALFVIVLPLFPSQAPEFVSQTILTKLWELIHLLFIGIAVAYGLFSRRHVEIEAEPHFEAAQSSVVDCAGAPNYVSNVFPSSTIFGDGNESFCGYDQNRAMHCLNSHFDGVQGIVCPNGGTAGVLDEQYKTQLPVSIDGFSYSFGCDGNGNNVVQAWSSEYYHSDPVVVVAQPPYYTAGESGEVVGYKPLGLPVRSLRSVAREVDSHSPRYGNESDSSFDSRGSSKNMDKSGDREFGDLGPSNSENTFNPAAAGLASPIPWRSRPIKMVRERRHGNVTRPSHFRPLSVDETKFEAFNSRSSRSTMPFSSHTGMHYSISADNMNFQEEEVREKDTPFVPASENMNFQVEDMGPKTSYMPAMENVNFQEEDMGQRKTSYVLPSEDINFKEESMGQRQTYYVPASEDLNFQDADLGKKIAQGSSLRNGRMTKKGKYAAVSYPSHFRPMSVDETPFESLSSQSFQSLEPFSSRTSKHSSSDSIVSDNMNFQEEDMEQKKSSDVPASENVNFKEDTGQEKTSYLHASENGSFQKEEDMGEQKPPYLLASQNTNFQEVDLGKVSQGSASRIQRMRTKGKGVAVSHPSHFRPMSIDETQFESQGSWSFQSHNSSLRSSIDSVSSENMNLQKEDLEEKKSSRGSSSSSSPSPQAKSDGEASLQPFHARGYSMDSLLKDDQNSNMNDDLRDLNGIGSEDPQSNKKSGRTWAHALLSNSGKPTSLAKALSRVKSVRTRRAGVMTSGTVRIGETSSKQTDEKVEDNPNIVKSVPMRKDKVKIEESALMRKDKAKIEEPDVLLKEIGKKNFESYSPSKPEVTFSSILQKRDKAEPSKRVSKEDLDIEFDNILVSSDEEVMSECVNDSGMDSEVDKKASEFIAKFKAQIRLQKVGSMDRSKGQNTMGNQLY